MTEEKLPPAPLSDAAKTEAATSEVVVAALARIEARLDRLESSMGGLGALAGSTPATVATVVDSADEVIARLQRRGVDVDDRVQRVLGLAEKLTEPATLSAMENGLELLRSLPATVATAADTFDSVVARLAEAGIDVDERVQVVAQVAERLTAPEALAAVCELLANVGAIHRLLESGIFAPGAVDVVDRAAAALADMDLAGAKPVGMFGAMRALGDPSVQRSLGALVEFGRRFGKTVHLPGDNVDTTRS